MTELDIAALRTSIDDIDDKLIALLDERSNLVKKVGMTKKKRQQEGQAFIRSGREATMIRRIYAQCQAGVFPAQAAAHIWRCIICASLSLESPLTVTAFAAETNHEIFWLAREYFGNFTPLAKQPTSRRTLGDVLDGKAEVGVLPLPDNSQEGAWWAELPEGIRIFASVPFLLPKGAEIKALAVAKVHPEATGSDISFLRLETNGDISQSRLTTLFEKLGLSLRTLISSANHHSHLAEINGFIAEDGHALAALKAEAGSSLLAITPLGAYAIPVTL